MRLLHARLRGGHVPELLIEDRGHFIIAMEAEPADAVMWKEALFAGIFEETLGIPAKLNAYSRRNPNTMGA